MHHDRPPFLVCGRMSTSSSVYVLGHIGMFHLIWSNFSPFLTLSRSVFLDYRSAQPGPTFIYFSSYSLFRLFCAEIMYTGMENKLQTSTWQAHLALYVIKVLRNKVLLAYFRSIRRQLPDISVPQSPSTITTSISLDHQTIPTILSRSHATRSTALAHQLYSPQPYITIFSLSSFHS